MLGRARGSFYTRCFRALAGAHARSSYLGESPFSEAPGASRSAGYYRYYWSLSARAFLPPRKLHNEIIRADFNAFLMSRTTCPSGAPLLRFGRARAVYQISRGVYCCRRALRAGPR